MMTVFLRIVAVLGCVGGACLSATPNIVLIVADDLGYGDLGCYGSTRNATPHIDALAAGGLRFTDFHSAGPMCSPTRAAMLTGQYQQRFGRMFDSALSGKAHRETGLPPHAVTMAELLRAKGYATACFGKWHLGYQAPYLPTDHGFDEFRGLVSGDGDYHSHIDRSGNADWWHNDRLQPETGYTTDLLTAHSVRFIREHRDRPFFLYLAHLAIHFPWQGPEDPVHRQLGNDYHADKWGIIPNRSHVAPHVTAMVEALDASTGKVLAALRAHGLEDETLIVFTSDNGGYLTYGEDFKQISHNGPLRGQKTELYEGGHRVPTIMRWPGKIAPGLTDAMGHSIDLLPTFAALAGIEESAYTTDGLPLHPVLFERTALPERTLYWRADNSWAIRNGDWKLVHEYGRTELYHLANDLAESRNVMGEHGERALALQQAWKAWETEMNP